MIDSEITVYYSISPKDITADNVGKLLSVLPHSMANDIKQYNFLKDQWHRAAGRHLLLKILTSFGLGFDDFKTIEQDQYGKLVIPGQTLGFNISHSGRVVVCAASRGEEVGVDVERIRNIKIKDFSHFFPSETLFEIKNSVDPQQTFFNVWTKTESVMKADGRGMSIRSTDVLLSGRQAVIKDSQKRWYVSELALCDGHVAHLCLDQEASTINCSRVDL